MCVCACEHVCVCVQVPGTFSQGRGEHQLSPTSMSACSFESGSLSEARAPVFSFTLEARKQ